MKQTPELDLVQAKMQPGVLTLKGFLGSDDRKLADIIAADQQCFAQLGVTAQQIAEKLQQLADLGNDLMEEEIIVENRYRIKVRDDRGKIPSPWGDGLFEKGDVDLIDNVTGKSLKWNRLTLRLLTAHGFCGGIDSDYRLDPEVATTILELKPVNEI